MRRWVILAGVLGGMATASMWPGSVRADSVSIGVQADSVRLGIHIGSPPPLMVVPGTPVYSAPSLPYNYFVYQQAYYLYHQGQWFRARAYNGPWMAVAIAQVPRPILAVPVEHYRNRPPHWAHQGPPPWAQARGHERDRASEKGGSHGKERGRAKGRDNGGDHS